MKLVYVVIWNQSMFIKIQNIRNDCYFSTSVVYFFLVWVWIKMWKHCRNLETQLYRMPDWFCQEKMCFCKYAMVDNIPLGSIWGQPGTLLNLGRFDGNLFKALGEGSPPPPPPSSEEVIHHRRKAFIMDSWRMHKYTLYVLVIHWPWWPKISVTLLQGDGVHFLAWLHYSCLVSVMSFMTYSESLWR